MTRLSASAFCFALVAALQGCYNPKLDKLEWNTVRCACTCTGTQRSFPGRGIAVGADDGHKVGTNQTTLTTRSLVLGTSGSDATIVGLRFPSLGIPRGSVITPGSAFIQFTSAGNDTANASFQIYAEDVDDATPLTGTPDLSNRVLTATVINWNVTTPWANDDIGPAQKTPDISALLQALISRPGWSPNHSIVIIIKGTGTRSVRSFEADPTKTATLGFLYDEPTNTSDIDVCLSPSLKRTDIVPAPDGELAQYCTGTVATTLSGLAAACKYASACTCEFVSALGAASANSCSNECIANDLATDCSNLDPSNGNTVATNTPGNEPVCTAHSPLASAIFGRRSLCDVSGTATVKPEGQDAESTGAHGRVQFKGSPCPGQSCAVAMEHDLRFNDITFGNFLSSSTFSNMSVIGHSVAGKEAVLASDGKGVLGVGATASLGGGIRDNDETGAFLIENRDVVNIGVNWQPGAALGCSVEGAIAGTFNPEQSRCENAPNDLCTTDPSVCGSADTCTGADNGDGTFVCQCLPVTTAEANVAVSLTGTLQNQPPTAKAGPDENIECNQAGKAKFVLDASATNDPDNNLTSFRWFRGSRIGDEVGSQLKISIEQALGADIRYFFRAIDAFGQADEASTKKKVVDTTAPVVACNAPATILPSQVPITFTATATDVCDPSATPVVTSFSCFKVAKNGTRSKVESCVVRLEGGRIHILNSGGVDDHIQWQVRAADQSGNVGTATCEVLVVQKK